jgi:uncharacterized protein involved in response to NO
MLTWIAVWLFGAPLGNSWPPTLWHAHEMIFGFVGAAIAGFLLTAVPSWTGQRGFAGFPLIILVSLWLCGRIVIASGAFWPAGVVPAVDVGFLVCLAVLLAPPLLRSRNRNTPLLLVLVLLAACNGAFHWALMRRDAGAASHALLIAIDMILLMVTVISGRILPAFTSSGLRVSGSAVSLRSWPAITGITIALMIAVALVDLRWPDGPTAGIIAGVAAVSHLIRLAQWRSTATLKLPILWILHVSYAWLPLGLALKSVALLKGYAISAFWLHALTVGALATMIMGVMTRAALGHTGRVLEVGPLTISGYFALLLAAIIRVFGLSAGLSYPLVIALSGSLFIAAFACFLIEYTPILWGPRADGKPG